MARVIGLQLNRRHLLTLQDGLTVSIKTEEIPEMLKTAKNTKLSLFFSSVTSFGNKQYRNIEVFAKKIKK